MIVNNCYFMKAQVFINYEYPILLFHVTLLLSVHKWVHINIVVIQNLMNYGM